MLVVGGGPYTGAPAFAGMAAMRSGVDLAFVATPEPAALPVSIYSPNLIVRPLKGEILSEEDVDDILDFSGGVDVVAIGPGLGSDQKTIRAVQEIVKRCKKPLVVDADAITACGSKPRILKGKGPEEPIRIWVPGCSTGEEVYSIAIALSEFLDEEARAGPSAARANRAKVLASRTAT